MKPAAMKISEPNYPGGSRARVSRAGENVRNSCESPEDLEVIDIWRAAHRNVLNTFQALLRTRARGKGVIIAQRHKRKRTIFDKLLRFPKMELARMDDIAGCRLIFRTVDELRSFRTQIHSARFKHRRRNEPDKYDYIKRAKPTGYRGIHDIYEYNVSSEHGKDYKGLFIELQYRTVVQHAWATCVEVIGFITESQPKFQQGDQRYANIMLVASEIFSRAFEHLPGALSNDTDAELVKRFNAMNDELGFLNLLRGLNTADSAVSAKKNVILIFSENAPLEMKTFRDATDALQALFELERGNAGKDVVLVRADTSDEVRSAFRNYFSDAREFIRLIEEGCAILASNQADTNAMALKS